VIAAPGPQHRVRRIPLESAAVQAMINTLELFMQLAAGMWPTIQLPAPPPLLRLRPRWGPPVAIGAGRLDIRDCRTRAPIRRVREQGAGYQTAYHSARRVAVRGGCG
jgi:hypothetical protein